MNETDQLGCGQASHSNRRTLLKAAGMAGITWLTPLANLLAKSDESSRGSEPNHPIRKSAKSVILLWLSGAPSQLETFDPHPGSEIASGSRSRRTCVDSIQLGEGFEQLSDVMDDVSIVRSVTSKEGDHERAVYNIKTGFRPVPTLVHPAVGSVICHQTESHDKGNIDIPRHVSILPDQYPGRGGYLGDHYDAFKMGDPKDPLPDLKKKVPAARFNKRLSGLDFLEKSDPLKPAKQKLPIKDSIKSATLRMMSSEQLKAFDINAVPDSLQQEFGGTSFGRGCLAAMQLISAGVRCVEITLSGWDSHVNNHEIQAGRIKILDPAFAALIRNLKKRDLLDDTIVLCGGEFGRTPEMNRLGGRDHWPHGFSIAMAGGGIKGGRVVGETSPAPRLDPNNRLQDVKNSKNVEDIHATVLHRLGIKYKQEIDTPVGRPMIISSGKIIKELL